MGAQCVTPRELTSFEALRGRLAGIRLTAREMARVTRNTRRVAYRATLPRMIRTILIVLLALWLLGFILRAFGGLIHLLLIAALVIVIYRLLTNRPVW